MKEKCKKINTARQGESIWMMMTNCPSLVTYNQLKHQKLDNVTLQQTNIQAYFLLRGSIQTFENYTKVRNDVNIKSKLRNGIF